MYLEVVFEVRLTQKDTVAVLVRAAKLLRVLVSVRVSVQLLLSSKRFITTLSGGREGGRVGGGRGRERERERERERGREREREGELNITPLYHQQRQSTYSDRV